MTGVTLDVELKDQAVMRLLEKIRSRLGHMLPAMKIIGEIVRTSVVRNFEVGGRPTKWKELSPVTLAMRRGDKILRRQGFAGGLMGSIHARAENDQVRIGTNKVYAAVQQLGAKKGIVRDVHRECERAYEATQNGQAIPGQGPYTTGQITVGGYSGQAIPHGPGRRLAGNPTGTDGVFAENMRCIRTMVAFDRIPVRHRRVLSGESKDGCQIKSGMTYTVDPVIPGLTWNPSYLVRGMIETGRHAAPGTACTNCAHTTRGNGRDATWGRTGGHVGKWRGRNGIQRL